MDDIRAVMDKAGVERAALFAWGTVAPHSSPSSPPHIQSERWPFVSTPHPLAKVRRDAA
jgi:hypothetical protein